MMRAPCTVQGPIPGIAVSSAMSSSSGSLLKTSGFSRPSALGTTDPSLPPEKLTRQRVRARQARVRPQPRRRTRDTAGRTRIEHLAPPAADTGAVPG